MRQLYDGTKDKLDYICTKMRIILNQFWYDNLTNERFTPNANAAAILEDEIDELERIIFGGFKNYKEWQLVLKYTALADEFRTMKKIG